jgi:hypothetical protein
MRQKTCGIRRRLRGVQMPNFSIEMRDEGFIVSCKKKIYQHPERLHS